MLKKANWLESHSCHTFRVFPIFLPCLASWVFILSLGEAAGRKQNSALTGVKGPILFVPAVMCPRPELKGDPSVHRLIHYPLSQNSQGSYPFWTSLAFISSWRNLFANESWGVRTNSMWCAFCLRLIFSLEAGFLTASNKDGDDWFSLDRCV